MNYTKVNTTDFFQRANYESLSHRLEHINLDSIRKWGTMNATQMLHHLNLAIGSGLGFYSLTDPSNFMSRNFIKPLILNVLKRFPVGAKTSAPLLVNTQNYELNTEKEHLKTILKKAFETSNDSEWTPHTYFGAMTRKEWGKLIMIHCNHHFQQFNN